MAQIIFVKLITLFGLFLIDSGVAYATIIAFKKFVL